MPEGLTGALWRAGFFFYRSLGIREMLRRFEQMAAERDCRARVNAGEGVVFYETARVFNHRGTAESIRVGPGSHIRGELLTFPFGGRIELGEHCYIGEGTRIWSGESVTLGHDVAIGHNVNIMDFAHESDYRVRAESIRRICTHGHPREKGALQTAPVRIGDYVAIYPGAIIPRGVTIGKGAVVSAGAVVVRDVPPFCVVAGNPAQAVWTLPGAETADEENNA